MIDPNGQKAGEKKIEGLAGLRGGRLLPYFVHNVV